MPRLDDDGFIPALAEIAESIREAGARAGIQLTPGYSSQARGAPWIPGLYAAGELMGGFHGASYMSGSAVGKAIIFGRIAGKNATEGR